jgi:7 transmembrane sweet-taste receptor of 3 GCPR
MAWHQRHGIGWGTYREPGNSGYDVNDSSMQLYFEACIDRETGIDTNCTMQPGDSYIQCVRNCGLMKCADEETQACSNVMADTSLGDGGGSTVEEILPDYELLLPEENSTNLNNNDNVTSTQHHQCLKNPMATKWCRQYSVEIAGNTTPLGFVPRTYHCHDSQGAFTQKPGHAVKEGFLNVAGSPNLLLGDCELENGKTKVERWERGTYVYCNNNNNNKNGNDQDQDQPTTCDNVFDGGFRSRDYDPRYRDWYIHTKSIQLPNWSPPYPFFSNLDLGITYSHPIYKTDNDTNRNIFEGVLAIDYTFADIGRFLVEGYSNSKTHVVVYEQAEPNFMVASSTGRKAASKVLASDESLPCPDDSEDTSLCTVTRESMPKLSGDPLDLLLVRAYEEQRDNNYPRELLTVKESDDADQLYIVQSSYYRPGGDLEWIILVISPAGAGTADAVTIDNPLFGVVCVIASLGFCFCLVFFWLFYRQRHERAVILADWRFTSAFLLGCALLNISTFTFLGENTDALCLTRMWSFHFLFALALSPLFIKVWRMWRMVGASTSRRPTIVNHTTAVLMSLPIVAVQSLILIIFSFVDPPRQEEVINIEGGIVTQHIVCSHESVAFTAIVGVYEFGLILTGCILAYVTRNLDAQFGEAKQLMFSMYNIAFIGTITTIVVFTMQIDVTGEVVLFAIAIFWATVFSSAAFVLPRLMRVSEERKQQTNSIMKTRSTGTNGPAKNSKVRFSLDEDRSSACSGEVTKGRQSSTSGVSAAHSNATDRKSNVSIRGMKKSDEPTSPVHVTPFCPFTTGESKTNDAARAEAPRRATKGSLAESATSDDGSRDIYLRGTGWSVIEELPPDAPVGRWTMGEADDDSAMDEPEESKQHYIFSDQKSPSHGNNTNVGSSPH